MLDFVNKVKWDAWKSLGSISQVQLLQDLALRGVRVTVSRYKRQQVKQNEAVSPGGEAPCWNTRLVLLVLS